MQTLKETMANRSKNFNTNSQLPIDNGKRVDLLLDDYKELIDQNFKGWFAKRFIRMTSDTVHRAAASVRETAQYNPSTDSKRLFCSLVKKYAGF